MSVRNLADYSVNRANISVNPLALLDRILAEIELTATQRNQAEQSYKAVTELLAKAGMPVQPFGAYLFAQGSMRLGTTVRPIGKDVHDLDIMCLLRHGGRWLAPEQALELIWNTLGQHATYREMRERKCRCIRLIYARQFNIDITPAVPEEVVKKGPLFVPDRQLRTWCSSHPVGFADWFGEAAEARPIFIATFSAKEGREVAANSQVEPLPEHGEFDKTPLQRITQLLKRDRDEHFQNDLDHRPSSILLTTLTARAYSAEVMIPAARLFEFVIRVVARLGEFIVVDRRPGFLPYRVANPVNEQENFAEKWTRVHYDAFTRWQAGLLRRLRSIADAKGQGMDLMLNRLGEGFGKERVIAAANALGADTSRLHQAGKLRVVGASGLVGLAGTAMGSTIYHGK